MNWTEIDLRLHTLGKDRVWLSDVTPYSLTSIRDALGPSSKKRSDRMLSVLSRAIEDEEARQATPGPKEIRPGVFEIFQTDEQLHTADLASRIVGAPSLSDYCRDVILTASERILAEEKAREATGYGPPLNPAQSLKVAEQADVTAGDGTKNL